MSIEVPTITDVYKVSLLVHRGWRKSGRGDCWTKRGFSRTREHLWDCSKMKTEQTEFTLDEAFDIEEFADE